MRIHNRIIPWLTLLAAFTPTLQLQIARAEVVPWSAGDARVETATLNPGGPNPCQAVPWDQIGFKAGADCQGGGLGVMPDSGGVRLHCVFQRLDGEATSDGLWLTSTVTNQTTDRFLVRAVSVGRAAATSPLPASGTVSVERRTVRFLRTGVTEEYGVSVDGVRQDFVVTGKPAGIGELEVRLAVVGARADSTMWGAQLVLDRSGRKIAYSRLRVTDATGKELPARIEVRRSLRHTDLAVVLDDAAAQYPVRIDPTFSDANWVSLGGGTDGTVDVTAVDGQGNLYIGGVFDTVGNTSAPYVAKWDGRNWSTLGQGMDNAVEALAFSPDGSVYVSGAFLTAFNSDGTPVAVNGVAKWDGTQWTPLGAGVTGGVYGYFYVDALALSGTNLYAGGYFSSMGGVPANYIAMWNGSAWSALGSGLDGELYADVTTLAFFEGNLYAGGGFSTAGGMSAPYIAQWNGSSWSPVGAGLDYGVNGLAVSGTNLYVGGNFNNAFNSDGMAVTAHYVAQWNGNAWSAVGTGMNNTVDAVAVAGNTLFAGGIFTTAGGVSANNIAQWDGNTWSAMGTGTSAAVGDGADVTTLATSGTLVYAGGNFTTAGGVSVNHVAAALLAWPEFQGGPMSNVDGSISLNAATLTQSTSRLYAASNLTPPIVWQPIYTNFTGGLWQFTDTNTAAFNSKFYLLSTP